MYIRSILGRILLSKLKPLHTRKQRKTDPPYRVFSESISNVYHIFHCSRVFTRVVHHNNVSVLPHDFQHFSSWIVQFYSSL